MPRLRPSLFWQARREISPLAAQLLPACRDLDSAANELRWIREHVQDTPSSVPHGLRVWNLVEKRGKGVPLQYVLGTQPFGNLEIQCRPGVLIPRYAPLFKKGNPLPMLYLSVTSLTPSLLGPKQKHTPSTSPLFSPNPNTPHLAPCPSSTSAPARAASPSSCCTPSTPPSRPPPPSTSTASTSPRQPSPSPAPTTTSTTPSPHPHLHPHPHPINAR